MYTDTHSHIYGPEFEEDVEEVISRAREVGVGRILLPNINAGTVEPMLALTSRHPDYLCPMMGLHPEDVADDYLEVLERMHALLLEPGNPYIAVGEVGLGGEVRSVTNLELRLAEAQRIGFTSAVIPAHSLNHIDPAGYPGMRLIPVSYISEVVNIIKGSR